MAAYPATQPRQKCRSIQRRGPPIQIRLLANLGIESRTLMFHLVKSPQDQSGLSAVWRKKKEKRIPSALTLKQIHGRVFTHLTQKCTRPRWMIERRAGRLADPLLAVLDRSAVAMATSSPGLVFGAAGGVTAEDFVLGTHLGGQLTWRCRLCSPSLLFQTHPIQRRYNLPD